ncbi:MAG: type I-U CRISPR-associated protein Csb2, partial [Maioricimonas sp. JB049]
LTGYAVATDTSDRGRAEWPPHPARVFMALAAAHFETGEDPEERRALEWLEEDASAPQVFAGEAHPRGIVTCYVPVNDLEVPKNSSKMKADAVRSALGVIPPLRSNKQPRTFPRVWIEHDERGEPVPVYLVWPDRSPEPAILEALDRLCQKAIRIGHSSSLVQMWVEESPPEANRLPDELGEERLRVAGPGTFESLVRQYNCEAIEIWTDLTERIARSKAKARKALQQERAERFPSGEPRSLRPAVGRWQGYRRVSDKATETPPTSGVFDPNLLVLTIDEGPVIGLESTWQLLTAMHKTLLSHCDPAPEWLSGHQTDGSPSQQPHVALLPLPFVGREYADGHLLGIALAFPEDVTARERGRALKRLLYDTDGRPRQVGLRLGSLGDWTLSRELRPAPPHSLEARTWAAASTTWASVTPIVLDRHPKTQRSKDRHRWSIEVAELIADSCERQGLPRPVGIDVDRTSWFTGVPRAVPGKGGGFPKMPVKPGQSPRQQVHAWLQFDQPVAGPLLLGAGRYRGFGLCRPWKERRR